MAKITTVTYRASYKIAKEYQSVEGLVEATGTVEENEAPSEAFRAVRAQVRSWLKEDHLQGEKLLMSLVERSQR